MEKKNKNEEGVNFPLDDKGGRSTSVAGKKVFAAAMESVNKELASKVEKERNWRFGYSKHVVNQVRESGMFFFAQKKRRFAQTNTINNIPFLFLFVLFFVSQNT